MKRKERQNITEEDIIDVSSEGLPKNKRSGGPEVDIYDDVEKVKLNEYYISIAYRLRIAKFLSFTLLIVFVLCMLTAFSDDITTEKFRYLMKDMNIDVPITPSDFGNISYTEDPEAVFGIFKNDVVSVGRHKVEVVDTAGNIVLNSDISYVKPRISIGEKYFLIYDLAGYDFSVYNSFSLIYSEKLDYPISHAYMSDDGRILIITKSDDYRCVAIMYNKDYEQAYTWKTNDKYVFDGVLRSDGSFTLLCASVSDGSFDCVTVDGNMKQDDVTVSPVKKDTMGLYFGEFESGKRVIFCTEGIIFEDENKDVISKINYSSDVCVLTEHTEKYALNIMDTSSLGAENILNVFSENGENILSLPVDEHPLSVYFYDEDVYIIYTDGIVRININNGEKVKYKSDSVINTLLQTENGIILAVGKTRAYPLDGSEFN